MTVSVSKNNVRWMYRVCLCLYVDVGSFTHEAILNRVDIRTKQDPNAINARMSP